MATIERRRMELSAGQVLRVGGPAFIRVYRGRVKAFGKELGRKEYLIIPKGETYVVEILEDAVVELRSGEGSAIDELKTSFIPPEWVSLANTVKGIDRPRVVVIGGRKSGRGALTTYLANALLEAGKTSALIDSSLSQPEVGPPAVVSLASISEPIPSLRDAQLRDAYFVGSITPNGLGVRVIAGVEKMLQEAKGLKAEALMILSPVDLFGWEARELVGALISIVRPDVIAVVEEAQEAEHLLRPIKNMAGVTVVRVPAGHVKTRSPEEWKVFREIMFKKYMGEPKRRVFHLDDVSLRYVVYGSGVEAAEDIYKAVGEHLGEDNVVYVEEAADSLLVITRHPVKGGVEELSDKLGRRVIARQAGVEQGLIVGLYSSSDHFRGVGIIDHINYRKGKITVLTGVEKASVIYVGLLRFSPEKWEEQGTIPVGFPF